jgi:hypothetical protein
MSTYIVEIAGDNSLSDFELMVAAEEAVGALFLKSSISFHENAITNLVTFEDMPPGQHPAKRLKFFVGKAPGSDNATPAWAGVILCDNKNTPVSAYRS